MFPVADQPAELLLIVIGEPEAALKIPLISQPPRMRAAAPVSVEPKAFPGPTGNSQVKFWLKMWRVSKSERLRSRTQSSGSRSPVPPDPPELVALVIVEPVSIDFDNV